MVYHSKVRLEKLTLEDDLTDVLELLRTFPEPYYNRADLEKRLRNKKYWIYSAKYLDRCISFAVWYESKPKEIYYWLTVTSDEHKKRGLAAKLFDFALKISKEIGYKKVKIKTFDRFKGMINLCKKRGFKLISVKSNKWGDNRVELVFDLDLTIWNPPLKHKKYNLDSIASLKNTGIYSVSDTGINMLEDSGISVDTFDV